MKIVICDDSRTDAVVAKDCIRESIRPLHIQADISIVANAEEVKRVLFVHKELVDLLILDIDMPNESGLELAKFLRSQNFSAILIFLTNYDEFVFQAFEFQPFRYIRKLRLEIEMPPAIQAAVKILRGKEDKEFVFHTEDGEILVMASEIVYFEIEKRKILMHLSNGRELRMGTTITDLQNTIQLERFLLIHRSCVVNADYVQNIQNDTLYLKSGTMLPISRRKSKEIRQQLMQLWGDSI